MIGYFNSRLSDGGGWEPPDRHSCGAPDDDDDDDDYDDGDEWQLEDRLTPLNKIFMAVCGLGAVICLLMMLVDGVGWFPPLAMNAAGFVLNSKRLQGYAGT